MALVIDGRTLDFALEDDIKLTFLELATHCKAVVCCRVSPLQKALVVKLVRKNVHDSVTLAIGDGANDVGMIQAAHVGVGISGQEGLQAARSADFAIAQFRFLRKLLLVHGGWAYARMSKLICYSFYKNITLYLIQMWFAINNAWSAQVSVQDDKVGAQNAFVTLWLPFADIVRDLVFGFLVQRSMVRLPTPRDGNFRSIRFRAYARPLPSTLPSRTKIHILQSQSLVLLGAQQFLPLAFHLLCLAFCLRGGSIYARRTSWRQLGVGTDGLCKCFGDDRMEGGFGG